MNECLSDLNVTTIIKEYGPLVSSICNRMIQNREDAEDAAQEAWEQIVDGIPGFRGDAKLSTWIYTVAYRAVMHHSQKERVYSTSFLRDYFHGDPLDVPDDIDFEKRIWVKEMCDKCLTGIIHCLDAEGRMAYLLRDMAQLPYERIAEIMEKEPSAIRKTVSRCRKKLRTFLTDECVLHNPRGSCACRMKKLVIDIDLPREYLKLRRFVRSANLYLESRQVLPQKNYWEKYIP